VTIPTFIYVQQVMVPRMLQQQLDNPPANSANSVSFSNVDLALNSNFIQARIRGMLSPTSSMPITISIGNTAFDVFDKSNNKLLTVNMKAFDVKANAKTSLDTLVNLVVPSNNAPLQQFITTISSQASNYFNMNGTKIPNARITDQTLMVKFNLPLKIMGFTMYSGLPLHKSLDLNKELKDAILTTAVSGALSMSEINTYVQFSLF
jgi:hypothetical protein